MDTLKYHPLCRLLPAMPDDELDRLVEDIRANGLREPITKCGDEILDGRSRLAACRMAGVEPRFVGFSGPSAAAFVASMNLHRRHLSASQRAAVAAELAEAMECEAAGLIADQYAFPAETASTATENRVFPEENTSAPVGAEVPDTAEKPPQRPAKSRTNDAAKATGAKPRTVQRARRVKESSPEVHESVKAGEITLREAERQIAPPKPPDDGEALRAEIRQLVEQIEVKIAEFCQTPAGAKHDRIDGLHRLAGISAWINGRKRRAAVKASGERDGQISIIYAAYPRQINPVAAKKAIGKALDIVPFDELLEAVREYAESTESWSEADRQFIPYAQKWFNQRRWEEDRAGWRRATKRKPSKTAGLEEFAANAARRGREVEPGVELIGGDDAASSW